MNKPLQVLMADKRRKEGGLFLIKIIGSYALWKIISFFLEHFEPQWWIDLQNFIATQIVHTSALVLQYLFSVELHFNSRNLLIVGTPGIYVADHCLGIPSMVVFTLFILFFRGKATHKMWYIPLGILGVFGINVLRIIGLGLLQRSSSSFFWEFNHSYTFLIMTYGLIFLMIKYWIDKYAS
jgi:exosortase/archaeosortase family protein